MGKFASTIRKRAAKELQHLSCQQPTSEIDPVLELMGFLLDDRAGGVRPLPHVEVTTEQWLIWNRLAINRQEELTEATMSVLEGEEMELPAEPNEMRSWAALLLILTLDRLEML